MEIMGMETLSVICPTCFETFEIVAPSTGEVPAELDYDCAVCCAPMVISVWVVDDEVSAEARSIDN